MYWPARIARPRSCPSAIRIGSVNQRIAQNGMQMAMAVHRPCRKVRRTSRTDQGRAPISRAIIGETALSSPIPASAKGK